MAERDVRRGRRSPFDHEAVVAALEDPPVAGAALYAELRELFRLVQSGFLDETSAADRVRELNQSVVPSRPRY